MSMTSAKKIINIVLVMFTLLNLIAVSYEVATNPNWLTIAFLAMILQCVLGIFYLQYRVYAAHSKKDPRSVTNQLRDLQQQLEFAQNRTDALFSIHQLIQIRHPLPIMRDRWTISADYGHALIRCILSKPTGNILDVGSGISTLLAGYAVEKRGHGKVIAIEHDRAYYEHLKKSISDHKLDAYISLHCCPLTQQTLKDESWSWYDLSGVEPLTEVNIVSIDGPPGKAAKLARYPALPLLHPRVATDTTYLLDDSAREDEQLIAARWANEFDLNATYTRNTKGMFVLNQKTP
jgi:hypothetical protein